MRKSLLSYPLAAVFGCAGAAAEAPASREEHPPGAAGDLAGDNLAAGGWLEDQEGRRRPFAEVSSGPALLILGTPEHSAESTRWDLEVVGPAAEGILVSGRPVEVRRTLDLRKVSRLFEGVVRARVRAGASPPGTPVLFDWDGRLATLFHAAPDSSTVILLDRRGREFHRVAGEPGPEARRALRGALEDLAAGGAP